MMIILEDNPGVGGNNGAGSPAGGDGGEPSVASRVVAGANLRAAMGSQESDPGTPTPTQAPAAATIDQSAIDAAIEKRLNPVTERLTRAEMENRMLRGMIRGQSQQAPAQPAPVQQPPAKPQKTDAQWAEELRDNPVATLRSLFSDMVEGVKTELTGKMNGVRQETGQMINRTNQARAAYQEELDYVNGKFPVQTNKNGHILPDFHSDMEQEWTRIQERDGGVRVGQLREAANNTAIKWTEEGKSWVGSGVRNGGAPANGNGNGGGGVRPTEIRTVQRQNVVTGSSPGGNAQPGSSKPSKLSDLNLSSEEVAAAREIIRQWNTDAEHPFTEADYVRNYLLASEEIPNYGN